MRDDSITKGLRAAIIGAALLVAMAVVGLSMAQAPAAEVPDSGLDGLIGVRLENVDVQQLRDWGIEPLLVSEGDGILADVTVEQLDRLRADFDGLKIF